MEQSSINVFERISAEYYNLTTAEKKAADYVLSHQRKAQDMSITELAAASGVAEATVSRFCRRLGCKGYNAFRLAIANSIAQRPQQSNPLSGEVLDDDSFSDVCKKLYTANVSAMTQTLELVRPEEYIRAADLLEQADRVLCMGQGGSMIIAMEAAHLFSTASGKFFSVTDSHMQAIAIATAGEKDVILFFSYSGATKDLIETLSYARERGLRSILVTHFANSPGAGLADVTLLCGADESPLQLGSVGARIAQMYLLDVLFSAAIWTHAARAAPASPPLLRISTCDRLKIFFIFPLPESTLLSGDSYTIICKKYSLSNFKENYFQKSIDIGESFG